MRILKSHSTEAANSSNDNQPLFLWGQGMQSVSIAIVERQTLLRQSLSICLHDTAQTRVIWVADSPQSAIKLLADQSPDVLLLSLDANCLEACNMIQRVAATSPETRVVILADQDRDESIQKFLTRNVKGYVLKGDSVENLLDGIRQVVHGGTYFSEEIAARLSPCGSGKFHILHAPDRRMTPHQLDIIRRLALGEKVKKIASAMHLSEKTIDAHKYRIMRQLGIHNRVELTLYAIREGLIIA